MTPITTAVAACIDDLNKIPSYGKFRLLTQSHIMVEIRAEKNKAISGIKNSRKVTYSRMSKESFIVKPLSCIAVHFALIISKRT